MMMTASSRLFAFIFAPSSSFFSSFSFSSSSHASSLRLKEKGKAWGGVITRRRWKLNSSGSHWPLNWRSHRRVLAIRANRRWLWLGVMRAAVQKSRTPKGGGVRADLLLQPHCAHTVTVKEALIAQNPGNVKVCGRSRVQQWGGQSPCHGDSPLASFYTFSLSWGFIRFTMQWAKAMDGFSWHFNASVDFSR